MKERPILMSSPMVRAILEGRKTQTRRIIKPQPVISLVGDKFVFNHKDGVHWWWIDKSPDQLFMRGFCPYGQVGDGLWVRETWQDYCPMWGGAWCGHGTKEGIAKEHQPVYRADSPDKWLRDGRPPIKWRPSIFMPRWASRITLEITGIRVERVQDISEEDTIAESCHLRAGFTRGGAMGLASARYMFMELWDSINGKKYPWSSNPWVWVIEFKKLEV